MHHESLEQVSRELLHIHANNLSAENRNIQEVCINGRRWHSTMLTHELIRDGAVIKFDMGAAPVDYTKQ